MGWDDGTSGRVALGVLRRFCPCALCEDLRETQSRQSGLHMISEAEMPSEDLSEVIPVGTYAIQIRWADGHDTGIYTYDYLRELVEMQVQ